MKPMNDPTLLPDDPQLTAYALGELEGDERAAVETALRRDPALRAVVEEIRATTALMQAALATEATADDESKKVVAFPALERAAILPGRDPYKLDGGAGWGPKLRQFPQLYFVVGGLAAACFAIVAALHTPEPARPAAVAAVASVTSEKVLVDMTALVPPPEAQAGPMHAVTLPRSAEPTPTGGAAFDAPRTLLEQVKVAEQLMAGSPVPTSALMPTVTPKVSKAGSDEGNMKLLTASVVGEGRVVTYPADEKFVITAVPQKPKPAAQPIAGTGFAAAETLVAEPAKAPGGGLMFLSPFTVSAERFKGRVGASAAAAPAEVAVTAATEVKPKPLVELPPELGSGSVRRGMANTETYAEAKDNDFVSVAKNPVSTFSIDADTASYANVRRFIQHGQRPPRDAVRIEELLNYFPYRYAPPGPKSDAPFATSLEVADAPWAPAHRLVRIGLKGREVTTAGRPAANLVFLLDVSGSMNAPNRLPLVKDAMRMLVGRLRADDRVAIVTYAGNSGLALPSTPVARASEILAALDRLAPGGSTNGALGLHLAYDIAKAHFVAAGINRVILCTDGDFNVGPTSEAELSRLIQEKAKSGVSLTVLGFGMGNLKDATLEKLADQGSGNYGYIDSRKEAEKMLVKQVNGTLVTIAKDVKVQVEFNPAHVASYRLIGYENRLLRKEDFANDKIDAGEMGAGHTVTALYEVIPATVVGKVGRRESEIGARPYNLYGGVSDTVASARGEVVGLDLLNVKVRYKRPDGVLSRQLDFQLKDAGAKFLNASTDFKFAAAVAGFGMVLRESPHKGTATLASVVEWAEAGMDDDPGGYRSDFIDLARQADAIEK